MSSIDAPNSRAVLTAVACYSLWGLMPLLFIAMAQAGFGAPEILAHRAVWSVFVAGALVLMLGQAKQARRVLGDVRTLGWLALSALLIAVNWGVYVWATTHHATLEASLGYYINPLLNVAAGAVFFRERLDRWGVSAIGLAAVGVAVQTAALGHLPVLSLILALTFCAYGIIRKRVKADAATGLFVECMILLPFGVALLVWLETHGQGGVGFASISGVVWALSSGLATVLPLVLFSSAARRLPLSTIGFIQFLAPTLQFGVGVWAGEPFTLLRAISFAFIWAGAGVFAWGAWRRSRSIQEAIREGEPV